MTSTARGTRCRTRTRGARDDAVQTYRGASPYTYAQHGMRRREPPQRYLPDEEATRPRTSTTVRTLHPLRAAKWLWLHHASPPRRASSEIISDSDARSCAYAPLEWVTSNNPSLQIDSLVYVVFMYALVFAIEVFELCWRCIRVLTSTVSWLT